MNDMQKEEMLLTQLIFMFQTAALQHMGKIKNPFTDRIERDLAQAQISIDMLGMLQKKTRGNLSSEEERMLTSVLQELKLNYVDEAAKEQPEKAPESAPERSATPPIDPTSTS